MRFDDIAAPVSDAEPCGPDLDEEGDEAYLNYVLSAVGRIPESFYQRDPNAQLQDAGYLPFDRAAIDLKSEVKAIAGLLERTRDLRLLALDARFHCLTGQVTGFCESLHGMALLVGQRWDAVHPQGADGDYTMRQNTVSGLDDQTSVLLPLSYAPLVVSRKLGAVCLRDYLLAKGEATRRPEDRTMEEAEVLEALRSAEVRPAVDALHAALVGAERSLKEISDRFIAAVGYEYSPDIAKLPATLAQIRDLLRTAVPELAAAAELAEEVPAAAPGDVSGNPEPSAAPVPVLQSSIALPDHAAASAALLAVEQYFARAEPSSPVLILIHQARTLVGKSLVEALEVLMPEAAERAVIAFANDPSFRLDIAKMKAITKIATESTAPQAANGGAQSFSANSRQEAENLIGSVEAFFHAREPSSPVPMLIGRARTYLNRDFSAILSDLVKGGGPAVSDPGTSKTN